MESYLGYPIFLWQGLINLISVLLAGLVIAFVTTFYLKRKDQSTRVAGVILEKRVEAQHEILRYLEDASQKLEMRQPAAATTKNLLDAHEITLPYAPNIQYADVFSSVEKYRLFFHEFEELFSKHKLWLDLKVRHQMLMMHAYFSAINACLIIFNRLPLPSGTVVQTDELKKLSNKLLFLLGAALDEELNCLLMDLEVLMVNSIYKLDLSRPKKSFFSDRRENREARKIKKFLLNDSLLGQYRDNIRLLAMTLFEDQTGIEITESQE